MNVRRQSKKNDSETEKTDASTSATANLPLAKRASDRIIATATKVRDRRRVPFNAVLLPKLSPKTNAASSNLDTRWDESTREAASGAKFSRSVVALALVPLAAVVAAAIYYGLTETRMALTSVSESEISDGEVALIEASSAEAILRRFLDAESLEERLKFVRHPDQTHDRMRDFYNTDLARPKPEIESFSPAADAAIGGFDFLWCYVTFLQEKPRTAVFEKTESGLKLDWELFVNYSEIPLKEFIAEEMNETHAFRLVVRRSDFFTHQYSDPKKYHCFEVFDIHGNSSCWAYCPVNSTVAFQMRNVFRSRGDNTDWSILPGDRKPDNSRVYVRRKPKISTQMVLDLRFVKNSDGEAHRQALIERVVSDSWLIP